MAKKAYVWNGSSWIPIAQENLAYPDQTGNSGKFLTTNGSAVSWGTVDLTPYATNSSVSSAISAHESDTTNVHGIANTSNLALTTGNISQFASTTSSQLAGVISDETGSGSLVFGTSPAITTSITTPSTSFDLFNTTATTINFGGAAATINIGSSTARVRLLAGSILEAPVSTNAQTGTSYTLALTDAGRLIEMNNASANTLTIPPDSSVAFPVGTKIDIIQTGSGETSIAPGSGVTLNSDGNKRKINIQWAAASLIKRGTNTWVLIGALKT